MEAQRSQGFRTKHCSQMCGHAPWQRPEQTPTSHAHQGVFCSCKISASSRSACMVSSLLPASCQSATTTLFLGWTCHRRTDHCDSFLRRRFLQRNTRNESFGAGRGVGFNHTEQYTTRWEGNICELYRAWKSLLQWVDGCREALLPPTISTYVASEVHERT